MISFLCGLVNRSLSFIVGRLAPEKPTEQDTGAWAVVLTIIGGDVSNTTHAHACTVYIAMVPTKGSILVLHIHGEFLVLAN